MHAAWLLAAAVLLAAAAAPQHVRATAWYADSSAGVDSPGCGAPDTPCKSVKVAMVQVNAGDTLYLVAPQQTPFPIESVVFISQSNVSVVGLAAAAAGDDSFPVLTCNTTTALYVTALGSGISNLTVRGCTHSAVIYDFESASHGHSLQGVTFVANRVAVGAEGCTLSVSRCVFRSQVAGDITMGGGNLTLSASAFDGVAPNAVPAGPLGSSVMCAKCQRVLIRDCVFRGKTLAAPTVQQQLPVVWIGNGEAVTVTDTAFGQNYGAALELQNVQSVVVSGVSVTQHFNATNAYGFVVQSVVSLALHDSSVDACGTGDDAGTGPGAAVWLSAVAGATFHGLSVARHTANANARVGSGALIVAHNTVLSVAELVLTAATASAAFAVASDAASHGTGTGTGAASHGGGTGGTAVSLEGMQWPPQQPNNVSYAVVCVSGGPNTVTTDSASTPLTGADVKCDGACVLALAGSSAGNGCASH